MSENIAEAAGISEIGIYPSRADGDLNRTVYCGPTVRTATRPAYMNRATPQMRNVATRLMALETRGDGSSERTTRAAFDACEKLRPQLATLMGNGGFRALLSRSLALAGEEVRWLRAVHVKSDGSLTGLQELHAQLLSEDFLEGGAVLLAQLLGLMVAFIGEDLTVRLLREIWPTLPLRLDAGKGDGNEKAK